MQKIAVGDEEAFRALYDSYATRLYRYALVRLCDEAAAEDVVQETLLAVWRQPDRYRGKSALATYLFGICHHKVVDWERKRGQQMQLQQAVSQPTHVVHHHDQLLLKEALESLSPEMRSVLILAFYYGFSYQEVAAILGIPEGTVKSRVFQARQKLQRWSKGRR